MLDRAASPPRPPGETEATFGLITFPYSESICEVIPARTRVVVTASGPSAPPAPLFEESERDGENWGDIGRGKSCSSAKKQGFWQVLDKKSLPPRDTSLMT